MSLNLLNITEKVPENCENLKILYEIKKDLRNFQLNEIKAFEGKNKEERQLSREKIISQTFAQLSGFYNLKHNFKEILSAPIKLTMFIISTDFRRNMDYFTRFTDALKFDELLAIIEKIEDGIKIDDKELIKCFFPDNTEETYFYEKFYENYETFLQKGKIQVTARYFTSFLETSSEKYTKIDTNELNLNLEVLIRNSAVYGNYFLAYYFFEKYPEYQKRFSNLYSQWEEDYYFLLDELLSDENE